MSNSESQRRGQRASVQAVAERAGVSKTTVSHILNRKHPYFDQFSEETIERVLRCAKELNYRPNILASGLKTGRSRLFAVSFQDCWTDNAERVWSGGLESMLISGISACAAQKHYFPVIGLYGERSPEIEIETLDSLVQAGVGGLMLKAPTEGTSRYLENLRAQDYPFVVVFPQSSPVGKNYVDVNNVEAGKLAVHHLISLGHQRIVCIRGGLSRFSEEERYHGYRVALEASGLEVFEAIRVENTPSGLLPPSSGELLRESLRRAEATAAYVTQSGSTISIVLSSQEVGISLPGNLALVGTDVGSWLVHGYPKVTSVGTSWFHIGTVATERLLEQMETEEVMAKPALIMPRLALGDTTPQVNAVSPLCASKV